MTAITHGQRLLPMRTDGDGRARRRLHTVQAPLGPGRCGPLECDVTEREDLLTLEVRCVRCHARELASWAPWEQPPSALDHEAEEDSMNCEGIPFTLLESLKECSAMFVPPGGTLSWVGQLEGALEAVTRQARERCDPVARRAQQRFHPSLDGRIYWAVRLDPTVGRVLQLADAHAGILHLVAHGAVTPDSDASAPWTADPLWRAVLEARPLREIVEALGRRFELDSPATRRLAWLAKHMPAGVAPAAVVEVARLLEVPQSDLPATDEARLEWLHALWQLGLALDPEHRREPWAVAAQRWASAHASELVEQSSWELGRLLRWLRQADRRPARDRSLDSLLEEQEQAWEEWAQGREVAELIGDFERRGITSLAPAPFAEHTAGDFHIAPITTIDGLVREGHRMGHCIASYAVDLLDGQLAVYHLELRGRASTVLLHRLGDRWRVVEHAGRRNRQVTRAETQAIAAWLRAAQAGEL